MGKFNLNFEGLETFFRVDLKKYYLIKEYYADDSGRVV
jgi:hypothetical protein